MNKKQQWINEKKDVKKKKRMAKVCIMGEKKHDLHR